MRDHSQDRSTILALATTFVLGTAAVHASPPAYEVIAATGRQAPGTSAGTTFETLGIPSMNAAGQVVYNATLKNAAPSTSSGMWLDDALVARAGDAAPGGISGLRFRTFHTNDPPALNDAGVIAFSTLPEIPGVPFASADRAIWAGRPGNFQLVAMAGMPAPGLGGALFRFGEKGGGFFPSASPGRPNLTESGQLAFWAEIDAVGGGVYDAIYAGTPSASRFIARGRSQAHDLPPGVNHGIFARAPLIDATGNVLFHSVLDNTAANVNNRALYSGSAAGVRLLRRMGDPVDEVPGARWGDPGVLGNINEAGQTFFAHELREVPAATASTLWFAEPHEPPRLVGRAGQPVPGSPEYRFGGTFSKAYLDDSGRVVFTARADPAGSTAPGPLGLWTGTADDYDLALVAGAPAPGTPDGVVFNYFDVAAVNANGMLAFTVGLTGAGVTASNDIALFAGMPGDIHLIAREGDFLEVTPGDLRKVHSIQFGTPPNSLEYAINDSDQIVTGIRFTDGTDVIFRVTVPEPASIPLLTSALLLLPRRRRNA